MKLYTHCLILLLFFVNHQPCDSKSFPMIDSREFDVLDYNNFGLDERSDEDYQNPKVRDTTTVEVSDWPETSHHFGQVSGLSSLKNGNLLVFHRGNHVWNGMSFDSMHVYQQKEHGSIAKDTIVELDRNTGKIIKSRGKDIFYLPHGIFADKEGNTWITDVALHQVIKLPSDTDVPSLTLGEAFVPGSDDDHFCQPSDVVVASNGDIFVTDGYCNNRIMKFSSDGKLKDKWGDPDMLVVHSITLLEDKDMVCVTDRENGRIPCYSAGLTEQKPAGRLISVCDDRRLGRVFSVSARGDYLYAITGPSQDSSPTGFTISLINMAIVDQWVPRQGFVEPHDIETPENGTDIYIAQTRGTNIIKFNTQ